MVVKRAAPADGPSLGIAPEERVYEGPSYQIPHSSG